MRSASIRQRPETYHDMNCCAVGQTKVTAMSFEDSPAPAFGGDGRGRVATQTLSLSGDTQAGQPS